MAINFENLMRSNFKSFLSPAAYNGHTITKSDFINDFENSFLEIKPLNIYVVQKYL